MNLFDKTRRQALATQSLPVSAKSLFSPSMNSEIYSISHFYKMVKCLTFLAHD